MGLVQRVGELVARIMKLKPVRVFTNYGEQRGAILAAGLSYQAMFAVFAAIWVAFSVAGFIITSSPELYASLLSVLTTSVPGLIDTGDGGAIKESTLLDTGALTWGGAIALVGLVWTALGWLASGRDAVRTIFRLPNPVTNFFFLKAKDLVTAIAFSVVLLVSAALSVLSTAALDFVFSRFGVDSASVLPTVIARVIGLALVLVIDTATLAAFFRVVSAVKIPLRELIVGALIGGIALGALKALGSILIGNGSSNPLFAGFAVIIGLLIWFNFVCQVILISASWIAVSLSDRGIPLSPRRPHEMRHSRPKRKRQGA